MLRLIIIKPVNEVEAEETTEVGPLIVISVSIQTAKGTEVTEISTPNKETRATETIEGEAVAEAPTEVTAVIEISLSAAAAETTAAATVTDEAVAVVEEEAEVAVTTEANLDVKLPK